MKALHKTVRQEFQSMNSFLPWYLPPFDLCGTMPCPLAPPRGLLVGIYACLWIRLAEHIHAHSESLFHLSDRLSCRRRSWKGCKRRRASFLRRSPQHISSQLLECPLYTFVDIILKNAPLHVYCHNAGQSSTICTGKKADRKVGKEAG